MALLVLKPDKLPGVFAVGLLSLSTSPDAEAAALAIELGVTPYLPVNLLGQQTGSSNTAATDLFAHLVVRSLTL